MFKNTTKILTFILCAFALNLYAAVPGAITATLSYSELESAKSNPPQVKELIIQALNLANQHLTYLYGSANPINKGMDCSGTIYYLLNQLGVKEVPRQADDMYRWVWEKHLFHAVVSHQFHSFEFSKLKPGYLLFWTGTYSTDRIVPVTHVMLYLGYDTHHRPIMFGSSDGRIYENKHMRGVSVFNFHLPSIHSKGRFIGYSCIPGISC